MDPFAALGVKSSKQTSGQSLQEKQKQQLADRARLAQQQPKTNDADAAFWDSFVNAKPTHGSGAGTGTGTGNVKVRSSISTHVSGLRHCDYR